MGTQMKKLLSLLLSLVMLVSTATAYGEESRTEIVDWDSYVSNHLDEFTTPDAQKWNQQFEEMKNNTAAPFARLRRAVDDTPRYIVLAIDNSGSMGGTPLAATKVASLRFCEQAFGNTSNTYIAIITYDNYAETVCGFSNDIQVLSNAIAGLRTGGTTSHYRGLALADQLLNQVDISNASKNIVIMSDGLPNDGPTTSNGPYTSQDYSSYRYANSAVNFARELHGKYSIYSLGFFHSLYGNNLIFGRRFMKDLANGGYWEVTDPDDLEFTFGDIADTIVTAKSGTFKYGGFINGEKDSTATYYYSDTYFDNDATGEPNPHLATMSLCLELSAWTSFDVPKVNENLSRNQKWIGAAARTQNARNLLTEIGFTNFETSPDWEFAPEMHSMGAVAAHKNINDTTVIALAVRGGGYYDEWGGNFVLGSSGNHEGFQKGRDKVYSFLEQYISNYKNVFKPTVKLWIVGFSRGGAVANMVAGKLNDNGWCSGVNFKEENIFAYTFEAPQGYVGNNQGYSNIHNYVYTYDLVPLVAPSAWGFQRYNRRDNLFTMGLGSKAHETLVGFFNSQYQKVLDGVPSCDSKKNAGFKLHAYAKQFDPKVTSDPQLEWFGFVPYVDWNVDVQLLSSIPTQQMLTSSVDTLFGNIIGGRIGFSALVEEPLSEVLAFCLGFENKIDWGAVIDEALFASNFAGIKKIVNELNNPFVSYDERVQNAAEVATEHICAVIQKRFNALIDIGQFSIGLTSLLATVLETVRESPWEFASFIYYLISTGFQCHWPELSLAYMMCQDSYYMNDTAFEKDFPESYRVIWINCPVDVTVYSEDNSVLSTIRGDFINNASNAHGSSITKEGTKQILLPSDAAYTINIKATDNGEMNYTVLEYNMRDGRFNLLQNYQRLPLETGDEYWGSIPAYIPEDYYDAGSDGSTTAYQLKGPNGGVISPSTIAYGEDIKSAKVKLSTNNNKGIVTGGGEYIISEFAKVEATCMPTVDFLGWYKDGVLVSNELEYRFEVVADIELVAKFSEGNYHYLSVICTEGGAASEGTCSIPSGVDVLLKAEPDAGYEFVCWESGNGSFDDPHKTDAVFTMPSEDSVVKAVFRPISANLPATGDRAQLGLWFGLLLLSGIAFLILKRRTA